MCNELMNDNNRNKYKEYMNNTTNHKDEFLSLEKEFIEAFDEFKKPFLDKMRAISYRYNKEKGEELILLIDPKLNAPDILCSMRFRMKLDEKLGGFSTKSIMEILTEE